MPGTYWIWEARSLCTRWLLCLLVISPSPGAQSQNNRVSPPRQSQAGLVCARGSPYPPVLPLVRLQAVQALHEAGDALLQAVDGVVLRVVPAEAVPEAAQRVPHQLQVTGLPKTAQLTPAQQGETSRNEIKIPGYVAGNAALRGTYPSVGWGSGSFSCWLQKAIALGTVTAESHHLGRGRCVRVSTSTKILIYGLQSERE